MATTTTDRAGFLQTWGALAVLCLTMFIIVLDTSMMNVAVPQITEDLNTSVSAVQTVIAVYSLTMASLMLAGGKLGTVYGALRVFRIALYVYGAGTIIATFSVNIWMLGFGWSVVEGVAAAALLPLSMSLVIVNYQGAKRALAFAVLGGFQATAAAVGPIVGGFLTTFLSWRVGFAFEVVIVIVVLAMLRYLAGPAADKSQTVDWVGTAFSASGLFAIVLGSLLAGRYGWWAARRPFHLGGVEINPLGLSPTPWVILLGLGLLVGFFHWLRRREGRGETPLVPTRVFRNGTFVAGFSTDALQSVTLAGLLFVMPLFMQSVMGLDPLGAGVALLPLSISVLLVSMAGARVGHYVAPKWLTLGGVALMGVGVFWMEAVVDPGVEVFDFTLPLLVFGTGTGLVLAQVPNLTLSSVDPAVSSEAAGVQNAAKEMGTSLGTALIGSVLLVGTLSGFVTGVLRASDVPVDAEQADQLVVDFEDELDVMTEEQQSALFAELDAAVGGNLEQIAVDARYGAMRQALAALGIFVLLAFLVATFLPKARVEDKTHVAGRASDRIPQRTAAPGRGV